MVTLVLADDGPGLPPGFVVDGSKGFGLMLVQMLCDQLNAQLTVESSTAGARWTVVFTSAQAEEAAQ